MQKSEKVNLLLWRAGTPLPLAGLGLGLLVWFLLARLEVVVCHRALLRLKKYGTR